jgi:hypothetical protein
MRPPRIAVIPWGFPELARSPNNPGRTVKGAKPVAPSPVWFPGRRGVGGIPPVRGAHPFLIFNPTNCDSVRRPSRSTQGRNHQ